MRKKYLFIQNIIVAINNILSITMILPIRGMNNKKCNNSAVWVLLKVNEEDLKIVNPDPEVIKKDLNKQINDLKKTNIKLQKQIDEEKNLKEINTKKLNENTIKDNVDNNLNTLL